MSARRYARSRYHAPWFCGSSWHQTTSFAFGILRRPPRLNSVVRERILLLEAHDRDVVDLAARAGTRAARSRPCREQTITRRTFFAIELVDLADHRLERAVRRARRASTPPPCAAAGSSGSSRSAACGTCRTICRRSRWKICAGVDRHAHLHVVLGAQLQDSARGAPTNARGPALRSRAAAASTSPQMRPHFTSPDADELVDHDLRAVGEIAELRFPDDELVRARTSSSRTRSRAPPPRTAPNR